MNKITEIEIYQSASDFRTFRRNVVETIVVTYSPLDFLNPAKIAASFPKFLENCMIVISFEKKRFIIKQNMLPNDTSLKYLSNY